MLALSEDIEIGVLFVMEGIILLELLVGICVLVKLILLVLVAEVFAELSEGLKVGVLLVIE